MYPVKAAATTLLLFSLAQSAEPVTYEGHIKPLMDMRCIACHGEASPLIADFDKDIEKFKAMGLGPRMDSYALLINFVNGGDAGALARRIDDGTHTKDGKAGNMHENLGDTPQERAENLALFKAWAGYWSPKRPDELSADEQKLFKALER